MVISQNANNPTTTRPARISNARRMAAPPRRSPASGSGLLLAIDIVAGLAGGAQRRIGGLIGLRRGRLAGRGRRGAHLGQLLVEVGLVLPDLRVGRRLGVR